MFGNRELETKEQARVLADAFGVPYSAAFRVAATDVAATPCPLPRGKTRGSADGRVPCAPLPGIDDDCHEFLRTWTIDMLQGLRRVNLALPEMTHVVSNGRALLPGPLADEVRSLWPPYATHAVEAAAAARAGLTLVDAAIKSGQIDRLQSAYAAAECVRHLVDLVTASDALLLALGATALRTPAARGGIAAFGWALDSSQGSLSTIWHCSGYVERCAQCIIGISSDDTAHRWRYDCGLLVPDADEEPDDLLDSIASLTNMGHPAAWNVPPDHDVPTALARQAARRRRKRLRHNEATEAFREARSRNSGQR